MKFKKNVFREYLSYTPLSLGLERSLECEIYPKLEFQRPILDIGCGEGLFASLLFDEKVDTGIDPDERELARARELGAYDELIQCKGSQIPKPDSSFGTIFSNSVFEHIPDLKPVIEEAYRLLKPGGRMYVTVPSENFDQFSVINQLLLILGLGVAAARYRKTFDAFWKHYHYYPLEHWRELFLDAGFEFDGGFTYDSKAICLLNDAMIPFAAFGRIIKKLTNRWVIFPGLRRILMTPWYLILKDQIPANIDVKGGGLVFLSLRKGRG